MLLFTLPIAIVIGVLIARNYAPKNKSEKILASILIPLISGVVINLLIASCMDMRWGFWFNVGRTLLFVAIPEVVLLITLFVALEVGGKKNWNDISTMKLHYGTGENRVDFEVNLTQKEILQMAKLREQDPEKWKDNELELVKAVRKGISVGKPIENESNTKDSESLTDNPVETETPTETPTAQNDLKTNEKLDNETSTEERKERYMGQEKNPETHHKYKMKRSVRIILAVVACIVLFLLFSALTTILGLKHGGGAIVMIAFMGLMAFVWRSIVGKKADDSLQNDNKDTSIKDDSTANENEINVGKSENEFALGGNMGDGLLANDTEPVLSHDVEEMNLSESELVENESKLQEPFVVKESVEKTKGFTQTDVKTIKKEHDNKLSKYLKILLIVILSLGIMFGLSVLTSFMYIRYIYPSKAKADDERLIQEAKDNPSKAYEIAQEMFKRDEKGHSSEFENPFSGERGICSYNHQQAGKDAANIYCQYMKDYAKRNLFMSDEIARNLFMNYDNHCNQLYNETGIEILKHAAEQGDSGAQFALGCYYNGLNYTKDDSWWSSKTIDNKKLDPAKAAYWYSKAADQGNTAAMGNLGMAYIQGEGVNRNEQKGLGLIKSAAERGNAFYQCRLGDFYRDGVKMQVGTHKETRKDTDGGWYDSEDKVREYWDDYRLEWVTVYQIEVADYKTILPKDMKQAKYWWKKAADNGNETAKERLQQIYE